MSNLHRRDLRKAFVKAVKGVGSATMIRFLPSLCPIILIASSCDWAINKFCGEPTGDLKEYIDSINHKYPDKLIMSQVPCYPGYAQVDLLRNLSESTIDSIENNFEKIHFREVLIYDRDNNLIRGNTGSM